MKKSILKMALVNISGPISSLISVLICIIIINFMGNKLYCFIIAPLFILIYIGVQALIFGDGRFAYLYIKDSEFALVNMFKQYIYNNTDKNEF